MFNASAGWVWDQDTARIVIGVFLGIALALVVHRTMPKASFAQRYVVVLIACAVVTVAWIFQDFWTAWQAQ